MSTSFLIRNVFLGIIQVETAKQEEKKHALLKVTSPAEFTRGHGFTRGPSWAPAPQWEHSWLPDWVGRQVAALVLNAGVSSLVGSWYASVCRQGKKSAQLDGLAGLKLLITGVMDLGLNN